MYRLWRHIDSSLQSKLNNSDLGLKTILHRNGTADATRHHSKAMCGVGGKDARPELSGAPIAREKERLSDISL